MKQLHITRRGALLAGLGATAAGCATAPGAEAAAFEHGVASGDPLVDRVVIWTRVTPRDAAASSISVRWVVAEDAELKRLVASGDADGAAANDFCVKLDVGGLQPGRAYFYGFFAGDVASPVGRAKTLPTGSLEQLRLAVFSCSNYPFGRFHAYADMARRGDVDFAIHLGDYIYETGGPRGWGWEQSRWNGRVHEPQREIISLDDYRRRYRQYRSDPDLQAAHAAATWILTWDDHEFANNPWVNGAQNHNEDQGEGRWADRKAAALRAYFEWMPIRDPEPGGLREAIWRTLEFGDLATLVMLETRLTGRVKQLDYRDDLRWVETAYYTGDPDRPPSVVDADQLVPHDPPDVERVRTPFDVSGEEPQPILDYERARAIDPETPPPGVAFRRDVAAFRAALEAPDRRMIAADQEAWLVGTVADAEARGVRWQLLGNQVIFARMPLFDFSRFYDAETIARLSENSYLAGQIELGRYGLPANLDAWDGYPAQRDRIADAFSAAGAHPIFVTGDSHVFWANEVRDAAGARCATEFGATGVSSPGFRDDYGELTPPIGEVMAEGYPDVRFVSAEDRGYLIVTLMREEATCEMIATSEPMETRARARVLKRWVQRRRDAAGALPALEDRTV